MDAIRATDEDAPTTELVAGAVGDRCTNCGAPLASDQRYCVNCGERRGKARFSFDSMAAPTAPAPATDSERPLRRTRFSSGATLVAGVATLLIAMGVGVLIGHDSNGPIRASAPQVITVGGGATGAGTGSASSGRAASSSGSSRAGKAGKTKVVSAHISARTSRTAAAAAGKVLGGGAPKNPTITVGQSCSAGTAGCQNGTFTGNYFGGQ